MLNTWLRALHVVADTSSMASAFFKAAESSAHAASALVSASEIENREEGRHRVTLQGTPQQAGRDYEVELANRYGGKVQPGSGSGVKAKLDWRLGNLLASVKHTTHRSYRLT